MKKIVLSAFALSLLLASCGGSETEKKEVKHEAKTEKHEEHNAKKENHQEEIKHEETPVEALAIELSSNDQMQFDKTELHTKAGQEVTLTLSHSGQMPKTAMGHNFVLLAEGVDIPTFAEKAVEAADHGYVPQDDKDVLAFTDVIGGGESATVTFTAPVAGTYDFICSFPGHYAIMKGKFIVD